MPKAVSKKLYFVFTKCEQERNINFEIKEANEFFGFDYDHVIPYIYIDNPIDYIYKAQEELKKSKVKTSFDQTQVESLWQDV